MEESSEQYSRVPCATLAANKFAKMMRKCKRDPSPRTDPRNMSLLSRYGTIWI